LRPTQRIAPSIRNSTRAGLQLEQRSSQTTFRPLIFTPFLDAFALITICWPRTAREVSVWTFALAADWCKAYLAEALPGTNNPATSTLANRNFAGILPMPIYLGGPARCADR
jgi:hypothetical protein